MVNQKYELFMRLFPEEDELSVPLEDFMRDYNEYFDYVNKYPKTVDAYWQEYRRYQTKGRLPKGIEFDDDKMSLVYKLGTCWMHRKYGGVGVEEDPEYEIIGIENGKFNKFVFKDKNGRVVKSIWDLRKEKPYKFSIEDLVETKSLYM